MALKISLEEIQMKPHPKFEGVKTAFIATKEKYPELSIIILEIAPGVQIPLHTHENEIDSILVLDGEGEMHINNSWQKVKAGDVIVVDKTELHGLKATGHTPIRCYVVHAPALW